MSRPIYIYIKNTNVLLCMSGFLFNGNIFYGNIFLLCCANCVLFKHVNSGICVLKCYQICCKICPFGILISFDKVRLNLRSHTRITVAQLVE